VFVPAITLDGLAGALFRPLALSLAAAILASLPREVPQRARLDIATPRRDELSL
jgi:hypothetical protein